MVKRFFRRCQTADPLAGMGERRFVDLAYRLILRRAPDPGGLEHFLAMLASGAMTRDQMLDNIIESDEFADLAGRDLVHSMHQSRRQWIRSLPPAGRILDLGGSAAGADCGALLAMGYAYDFKQLVIVDLPLEQRHRLSAEGYDQVESVAHAQGPVRYHYSSMTDLGGFDDASFDMVHSGQSIEHVTEAEADHVLAEAWRMLEPGGWLCLDTPNATATRLQSEQMSHPDHKIEYTHGQLAAKIRAAGFEITRAMGLNHLPKSLAAGVFDISEAAANLGVYHDIEACYLLAYCCRKSI